MHEPLSLHEAAVENNRPRHTYCVCVCVCVCVWGGGGRVGVCEGRTAVVRSFLQNESSRLMLRNMCARESGFFST